MVLTTGDDRSLDSNNKDKKMSSKELTIFYDGRCPLCSLEMQRLKQQDLTDKISLEDLHQDNFEARFPHINVTKALAILHGEYQGNLLLGLEVTHRAWTLVGKGGLVAPLQWPVIKQVANASYLILAKYRYPISSFIHRRFGIGINTCEQGTCYERPNNTNHRR